MRCERAYGFFPHRGWFPMTQPPPSTHPYPHSNPRLVLHDEYGGGWGQRGYCIIAVSFLAYSYLRHGRHLLVVHCPPGSRLPVRPSAPPPRTHAGLKVTRYSHKPSKVQYRKRYYRDMRSTLLDPTVGRWHGRSQPLGMRPAVVTTHTCLLGIGIIGAKGKPPELLKVGEFWCLSAKR